jgi:hypothetical protein
MAYIYGRTRSSLISVPGGSSQRPRFAAAVVPRSAPICAATAHAQADLIEPETRLSDLGNLQNVVGRVALNLLSDLKK